MKASSIFILLSVCTKFKASNSQLRTLGKERKMVSSKEFQIFFRMLFGMVAPLAATLASPTPHIVMVLTDDNGWAGVGYNNPNLHSPNLDTLAKDGLILTSHYV